MNRLVLSVIVLCWLVVFQKNKTHAQLAIQIETGMIWVGYNNVAIPGATGTRFSLKNDLKPENKLFYRVQLRYQIYSKHNFSALFAPFSQISTGETSYPISFAGKNYSAHTPLEAIYKFNSYRISYCYHLLNTSNLTIALGITGKVRDAKISLASVNTYGALTDFGFVPLINFKFEYKYNHLLSFIIEGDALASKYGRAEDVLLATKYKWHNKIESLLGYRVLEGGSNGSTVYTFALFHYATIGVLIYL